MAEILETRPGQVYGSWSESDESANQIYACNERSVSKIKPAPTSANPIGTVVVLRGNGDRGYD